MGWAGRSARGAACLWRFYEFGGKRHGRSQRAGDPAAARRALQARGLGERREATVGATAQVGAAAGQRAVAVEHRLAAYAGRLASHGDAQELGLRRDSPAADAAAAGHVRPYVVCSSAASTGASAGGTGTST
jgi:hypothetical protein